MRRALYLSVFIALFSIPTFAAKGGGAASMGGVGFLFPDMNEFVNPGQMALMHATAFEAYYTRDDQAKTQSLTPSLVTGNGKWGGGVFASRSGNNFSDSTDADRVGAAVGMGFAGDRLTVGAGYDRQISTNQVDDGTADVAINFNGKGRMGFAMGAKATSTINALTTKRTATVGVGYGFSANLNAELYYALNDLDDTANTTWGGAMTLGAKNMYLSGGYSSLKNTTVGTQGELAGRLGFVFSSIDISAHAEKVMVSGSSVTYGGAFRVMF